MSLAPFSAFAINNSVFVSQFIFGLVMVSKLSGWLACTFIAASPETSVASVVFLKRLKLIVSPLK